MRPRKLKHAIAQVQIITYKLLIEYEKCMN